MRDLPYKVWAGDDLLGTFFERAWAHTFADMASEEYSGKGIRVRVTKRADWDDSMLNQED